MRKEGGVVHAVARCDDCGREFENYKNAQGLAAQHAKKYGHTVQVEVGIAYTYYGGREEP